MSEDSKPAKYLIHFRNDDGDESRYAQAMAVSHGWLRAMNRHPDNVGMTYWLEKVEQGAEALTGYETDPRAGEPQSMGRP